jgi:hypothetical protein
VIVAIRPEDVVLHREGDTVKVPNILHGTIEVALFTGVSVEYHVRINGEVVQAHAGSRLDLNRGDRVAVELPPDPIRVFALDRDSAKIQSLGHVAPAIDGHLDGA